MMFYLILFGILSLSFDVHAHTRHWVDSQCVSDESCPNQMFCNITVGRCQCNSDADCPSGYGRCAKGVCYKSHECKEDLDCPDSYACNIDGETLFSRNNYQVFQNICQCIDDSTSCCLSGSKVCADGKCFCTTDSH